MQKKIRSKGNRNGTCINLLFWSATGSAEVFSHFDQTPLGSVPQSLAKPQSQFDKPKHPTHHFMDKFKQLVLLPMQWDISWLGNSTLGAAEWTFSNLMHVHGRTTCTNFNPIDTFDTFDTFDCWNFPVGRLHQHAVQRISFHRCLCLRVEQIPGPVAIAKRWAKNSQVPWVISVNMSSIFPPQVRPPRKVEIQSHDMAAVATAPELHSVEIA